MSMSNISIAPATVRVVYVYGRFLEAVVMSLMVILFLEVMVGVVFRMLGTPCLGTTRSPQSCLLG